MLMQELFSDFQKESEYIVTYGSRLERTLSKVVKEGQRDEGAKDSMFRSKVWTGLKNQQLRQATRHKYDTIHDFQILLKEIRKK